MGLTNARCAECLDRLRQWSPERPENARTPEERHQDPGSRGLFKLPVFLDDGVSQLELTEEQRRHRSHRSLTCLTSAASTWRHRFRPWSFACRGSTADRLWAERNVLGEGLLHVRFVVPGVRGARLCLRDGSASSRRLEDEQTQATCCKGTLPGLGSALATRFSKDSGERCR